jgi:hypothetical protein
LADAENSSELSSGALSKSHIGLQAAGYAKVLRTSDRLARSTIGLLSFSRDRSIAFNGKVLWP